MNHYPMGKRSRPDHNIEEDKEEEDMDKIEMTKMHYEIAAHDFIEWYNKNIPHHTEVIDMDYLEMYMSSK